MQMQAKLSIVESAQLGKQTDMHIVQHDINMKSRTMLQCNLQWRGKPAVCSSRAAEPDAQACSSVATFQEIAQDR